MAQLNLMARKEETCCITTTLFLMVKKEKFVKCVKESKMGNIKDAIEDIDKMKEQMNKDVKTYKREVACVLLLCLGYVVYTGNVEMVNALVWPIVGFAAGAFGLDAFKQLR